MGWIFIELNIGEVPYIIELFILNGLDFHEWVNWGFLPITCELVV